MADNVAVVVTYNRRELLMECIQALLHQTVPVDILVIDNASTDGTAEALQPLRDAEQIRYFNTGANLGGAGGFHYGIKKAWEAGYPYIWIMDDDTIPTDTALEELVRAGETLQDRPWGFLASRVVWKDGSLCAMNCPVAADQWYENIDHVKNGLLPIRSSSFVSCYLRRDVIGQVGLPIREFVIWKDDTEYTERISDLYTSYLVSDSVVLHKIRSNVATPIECDSPERLWRYRYLYRNMYYIARKNGKKAKLDFHFEVLRDLARVLRSDCEKKGKRMRIILGSVLSGYRFHPEVEFVKDKI